MLRLAVFVCFVAAIAGMDHGTKLKKYAYIKIVSSCWGEEATMDYIMKMKAAGEKCKGDETAMLKFELKDMLKDLLQKPGLRQSPKYVPYPVYQPVFASQPSPLSQFPQMQNMNQMPMGNYRWKRSAEIPAEKLEMMKQKLAAKISNITCVFKEIGVLDANKQINRNHYRDELAKVSIDEELKNDLMAGSDECIDFAMCLPVEKSTNPLKKELGQVLAYMKCAIMKDTINCMKHDMRKMAAELGLPAMPDPIVQSLMELTEGGSGEGADDLDGMLFGTDGAFL